MRNYIKLFLGLGVIISASNVEAGYCDPSYGSGPYGQAYDSCRNINYYPVAAPQPRPNYYQPAYRQPAPAPQPRPQYDRNSQSRGGYQQDPYNSGKKLSFYVGASGGISLMEGNETISDVLDLWYVTGEATDSGTLISSSASKYDFDMDFSFSGYAGIKLSNVPVRGEAEYIYFNGKDGTESLTYTLQADGTTHNNSFPNLGTIKLTGFMFNAFFDINQNVGGFSPYVGAGFGSLSVEIGDEGGYTQSFDGKSAMQFMIGALMPMDNMKIGAEFRYLSISKDTLTTIDNVPLQFELTSMNFLAKVMMDF